MERSTWASSEPHSIDQPSDASEFPKRYFPWIPILLAIPLVLMTFAIFASFAPPS